MQRIRAKLSSKSQVTLPAKVRAALHIKPGDQIVWEVDDAGQVVISAAPKLTVRDLKGIVPAIGRPMSDDFDAEIEEAMADVAARKHPLAVGQ
jgi:antitoxin PrlF